MPMGADRLHQEAEAPWFLAVLREGEALGHISLTASHTTLGREPSPETNVVLPDPAVSRLHVAISSFPGEPALWVQDLGSSNGTFLNRQRISGATAGVGDVLRVGDSLLVVGRGKIASLEDAAALGLVGRSPPVGSLRELIGKVAPSALSVLIVGPTGTGKELVARAIHEQSGRRGRFVAVNCAALPSALVESTLFGHKKGAFTGAVSDQEGAFLQANEGTLFLDEVGDLALEAQPKLLRALESGEVLPVGATHPIATRCRLVAATHVALDSAIEQELFRRDLFARLAGAILKTPALIERRDDILALFSSFLPEGSASQMSADFIESLLLHPWPFNVRELRKLAERLAVLNPGVARWERSMLGEEFRSSPSISLPPSREAPATVPPAQEASVERKTPPEPRELVALLESCGGNVSEVAKRVGRNRKQVYRWMAMYSIEPGTGRKGG